MVACDDCGDMDEQAPEEEELPLANAASAKYPLYLVDAARIGSAISRRVTYRFRELLIMLDAFPEQYLTASRQTYTHTNALTSKVHRSLLELLKESEELGRIHSLLALLEDAHKDGDESEAAALQNILNASQALSADQEVLATKRAALLLLEKIPGRGALSVSLEVLSALRLELEQRETSVARDVIITEYQLMRLGFALDMQLRDDGLVAQKNPERLIPLSTQLKNDLKYIELMRVLSHPTLRPKFMAA